jgi:hypothetical protein
MQDLLGNLHMKWEMANIRRTGVKFGLQIGDARLTNLRFADDVILTAQSKTDIQKMLTHFAVSARHYGLKIHPGKTKVMTWNALSNLCPSVFADGMHISIISENQFEKYLGRKLCFGELHATELRNRISLGWAAFHQHKAELCSKYYCLKDRLRLFDAVISPTVLYGSAAWALTAAMKSHLRAAWRKMLRYVFRFHQATARGEEWSEYMQRSAYHVDSAAIPFGMEDWVGGHRRRKFRFAGEVAGVEDNLWLHALLQWTPDSKRSQGRPVTRWSDDLVNYAGSDWACQAADQTLWEHAEDMFVSLQ